MAVAKSTSVLEEYVKVMTPEGKPRMYGGWVSSTMTRTLQLMWLEEGSLAVTVTDEDPTGKLEALPSPAGED